MVDTGPAHPPTSGIRGASGDSPVLMTAVVLGQPSNTSKRLEQVLEAAGFRVMEIVDLETLFRSLPSLSADLIVLDALPGGRCDLTACQTLVDRRPPPVLALGGLDEADRALALEIGADDCVPVEVSDRELAAKARALTRRSGRRTQWDAETRWVSFAGWRVATDHMRELRASDGATCILTPLEAELLGIFLRHPGRTLSCVELQGLLWISRSSSRRAVDVAVFRLGKKLGEGDQGAAVIKAVGLLGYLLDSQIIFE